MACLGKGVVTQGEANIFLSRPRTNRVRGSPNRVWFPRNTRSTCAAAVTAVQCMPAQGNWRRDIGIDGPEKLDRWMKESVGEIVKNLQQAPLFVHVYGGGPGTSVKPQRAVPGDWAHIKGKWVNGDEPTPEGIILVEELKEDEVGFFEEDERQNGESTKAWGVLIQGKGDDGGVACYLLKTSKVGCGNLGLFCTHYCLVRVNSFTETARSQLTNCWLA